MHYPFTNFLGSSLIPELGADITAGPSGYVHFVLIPVAAMRTFPNQLMVFIFNNLNFSVIAAYLAVITFCVQLSIHNVIINVLHYRQNGINIILHVRNFHIADGAAGRKLLELAFELELGESVDLLRHMDMVAVGDIVLVGDAGDDAEPLLQAGGKLVGGGFQRGAVEGVVDVLGLLPRLAAVVHMLHHAQGKGLCLGVGVALAGHILDALI